MIRCDESFRSFTPAYYTPEGLAGRRTPTNDYCRPYPLPHKGDSSPTLLGNVKPERPMMIYPLRFHPIFRQYLWGGRRLETALGKRLGDGDHFAESWEVVDRANDQSVIANGVFAGQTLSQVLAEHCDAILGRHHGMTAFPLLLKFLDCNSNLSVQVHPDDARAALLVPPDLGKTEAWVVIEAQSGSKIYAGLRPGVDSAALAAAVETGSTESLLHDFEPHVGDCVFIPAGVVHALGSGLVIAEIQQCSDTTYRLFDWNRVDDDGNSRALHIEQALEAIDYDIGPISAQVPQPTDDPWRSRLVECDKFILDRLQLDSGQTVTVSGDNRVHLLAMLSGAANVDRDPADQPLTAGQTMMIPAAMGSTRLIATQKSEILDIYLP
jgi:mannose-6-phosphate isomerase